MKLLFLLFSLLALARHAFSSSHDELTEILRLLERQLRGARSDVNNLLVNYGRQTADAAPDDYINEWAVQIDGGPPVAQQVAQQSGYEYAGQVRGFGDTYVLRRRDLPERSKRGAATQTKRLAQYASVLWVEQQRSKRRVKRDGAKAPEIFFNDPLWSKQWPLHDTRTRSSLPKLDLHVIGAWRLGYTGKGVVVTILDDGIQHNHTDLHDNYDAAASYDLNDNDPDPMPTFNDFNKHGTRCAGEVAMVANNHVCGVGIAFGAKIGGIRMLDGRITDRLEAEALKFNIGHVDIFSASWGPNDDGQTVEGPGVLAERAILDGIRHGRGGRGTIYVWASGNGGSYQDDCDCDGYTDSIYTLSVSSASQSGQFPWYGEKCASTLTTTYSSGAYTDQKITTTDIRNECTSEHTGTSASAPLAAGIVALGLQANSALTWRDVQHIVVWTAEPAPLMDNEGWHMNGRGLLANTRFGFGLMNAEAFVVAASQWTPVPEQRVCTTYLPTFRRRDFRSDAVGRVRFRTDACAGQRSHVRFVEHVQLVTDITYTRRGNLAIFLVSPNGTRTKLLSPRRRDDSTAGFSRWPFMSVHSWGEEPAGWWTLEILDKEDDGSEHHGSINNITLILSGTSQMPAHYSQPRAYNMEYNQLQDRALHELRKRKLRNQAHEIGKMLLGPTDQPTSTDAHRREKRSLDDKLIRIDRALTLFDELNDASADDDTSATDSYENTWSR